MLHKNLNLLILDADDKLLSQLQTVLKNTNLHNIKLAWLADIHQANGLICRVHYDALLLNLEWPDRAGLTIFNQLHMQFPEMPIVVLSDNSNDDLVLSALRAGAHDFLSKTIMHSESFIKTVFYAIERAKRRTAERALQTSQLRMRIAREVQFSLFPVMPPMVIGYDIAGVTFSAEAVDGDYYDFLEFPDGDTGLVISDACGHGVHAAMLMVQTRGALHALVNMTNDLSDIVTRVNDVLYDAIPTNRFVTLLLVKFKPKTGQFSFVNAGHPYGYVLKQNGEIKTELRSTGLPLGVDGETQYPMGKSFCLEPGELAFFFTDGVYEARSTQTEDFGTSRVLDFLRKHQDQPAMDILEQLNEIVSDFRDDRLGTDDVTFIVIKRNA